MHFKDRFQAGRLLAVNLAAHWEGKDAIVLALPRGGVAVGYEVAVVLRAPLDVLVVRKVGLPGFPEMAMGAVACGGIEDISSRTVERFQISPADLRNIVSEERRELDRQEKLFRDNRPFPEIYNKEVILVDDGLATGHTMKAAITAVRSYAPREVIVAVPVGAAATCRLLARHVDQLACLFTAKHFVAVGAHYDDFHQVSDDEVIRLLRKAKENATGLAGPVETPAKNRTLSEMRGDMLFVKSARVKLSHPQAVEIGLSDGRVVRVSGEAAREPINAIALAAQRCSYHSTFGLPVEGGSVLVVGVDGKSLSDTTFN